MTPLELAQAMRYQSALPVQPVGDVVQGPWANPNLVHQIAPSPNGAAPGAMAPPPPGGGNIASLDNARMFRALRGLEQAQPVATVKLPPNEMADTPGYTPEGMSGGALLGAPKGSGAMGDEAMRQLMSRPIKNSLGQVWNDTTKQFEGPKSQPATADRDAFAARFGKYGAKVTEGPKTKAAIDASPNVTRMSAAKDLAARMSDSPGLVKWAQQNGHPIDRVLNMKKQIEAFVPGGGDSAVKYYITLMQQRGEW